MKPAKRNEIELRRAHDVRRLRVCSLCGGLGDSARMLALDGGLAHGSCVVESLTVSRILSLPASERSKLRLGDTGPDLMRALLDSHSDE